VSALTPPHPRFAHGEVSLEIHERSKGDPLRLPHDREPHPHPHGWRELDLPGSCTHGKTTSSPLVRRDFADQLNYLHRDKPVFRSVPIASPCVAERRCVVKL